MLAFTPPRRRIVRLVLHVPPPGRQLAAWALTLETIGVRAPSTQFVKMGNTPCPWDISAESSIWRALDGIVGAHVLD